MIKFFRFLVCLALPVLLLFSCSSEPKHPAELATADSLTKVMKKADSLFLSMKKEEVEKALSQISYNLAYIQKNRKDTLTRSEAEVLTNFHRLRSPLTAFLKQEPELKKIMAEEKKQCENLSHDLRHNTLDEKLNAQTCVANERVRVSRLIETVSILAPAVAGSLQGYKEQLPGIESRVKALREKGGQEPEGDFKKNSEEDD